jgi:hypothetical protein
MRELKSEIIHLLVGLVSVENMVAVSDVCDKFQSRLDAAEALKPSHNKASSPCHRCSDYELILDVNFCPFCGFEFVRG